MEMFAQPHVIPNSLDICSSSINIFNEICCFFTKRLFTQNIHEIKKNMN